MNEKMICAACGTQFPETDGTPTSCLICEDDRQYVPDGGQAWTTAAELAETHAVAVRELVRGKLYELKVMPIFAIGQRALLVVMPGGNILWDCIPLLDAPTVKFIRSKGGLAAIAFSHPHFYSTMNEWASEFACPIYIHENDERWIANKGERVKFWSGIEKILWDGITLINIGGHFPGSSILHVPFLSNEGSVLCGDTFVLSPSKEHLAAMHSYPNRIPLPLDEVRRIEERMKPLRFGSLYGWNDSQNILSNAKAVMTSSFQKYI